MTALHQALYSFWNQFLYGQSTIPAYLTGKVPKSASFPYFTFDVKSGSFASVSLLTAFLWVKDTPGTSVSANATRAAILDTVCQAIPEGGVRLSFEGGYVYLFRNDSDFITYYDDPEDPSVIGGRISYEVHFYQT